MEKKKCVKKKSASMCELADFLFLGQINRFIWSDNVKFL